MATRVFKLRVNNPYGNQAAWHLKLNNASPKTNWMDTAKRIGYFPRLTKFLKELEQARSNYDVDKFTDKMDLTKALAEVRNDNKIPFIGKKRNSFPIGKSVPLEEYVETLKSNE